MTAYDIESASPDRGGGRHYLEGMLFYPPYVEARRGETLFYSLAPARSQPWQEGAWLTSFARVMRSFFFSPFHKRRPPDAQTPHSLTPEKARRQADAQHIMMLSPAYAKIPRRRAEEGEWFFSECGASRVSRVRRCAAVWRHRGGE